MDKASEALLALKPVTFRYKKTIDAEGKSQFGMVAEDVEKVNPDLVVRDDEGKPYSVRYEAVNAMLLNEFLKEHRTVQEQESTIAQLKSVVAKHETTAARQHGGSTMANDKGASEESLQVAQTLDKEGWRKEPACVNHVGMAEALTCAFAIAIIFGWLLAKLGN